MISFLESLKLVSSRFKSASPSNKRQIVETFCANFEWDGEKLSWDWKDPYHIVTNCKEKGNWLRALQFVRTYLEEESFGYDVRFDSTNEANPI